jgi:Ca2+-binding RTX toxin-like protein
LPNDKDDFIKQIVDNGLAPLGYDPVGLNNNLPQAEGLINAKLLQGDYIASHTYGWTEFNIDAETQKLTLTTYGVEAYTREELEANPNAVINRQPKIVSQFEVDARNSGIQGTAGDDTLYGTNGDDIISALGGNNTIYAGEGNNTIFAADGNNTVYVGAGNDRITTGNGNNTIYAGEGVNTVNTGSGNDLIYAGAGNDVINAGVGNNTIFAGEGNNTITSSGIDTIFALSGSDRFILSQGTGIATIIKFDESDRITLTGGLTFSNLNISQSGDDTFISAGADLLATLKYTQSSTITSAIFA